MAKDRDGEKTTVERLLRIACTAGADDALKIHVLSSSGIDSIDENGFSALMHVARNGQLHACRVLLSAGASTSLRCAAGKQAMELAADHEQYAVVALLQLHESKDQVLGPASKPLVDSGIRTTASNFDQGHGAWLADDSAQMPGHDRVLDETAGAIQRRISRHVASANETDWCSTEFVLPSSAPPTPYAGNFRDHPSPETKTLTILSGTVYQSGLRSEPTPAALDKDLHQGRIEASGAIANEKPRPTTAAGRIWAAANRLTSAKSAAPTLAELESFSAGRGFGLTQLKLEYRKWCRFHGVAQLPARVAGPDVKVESQPSIVVQSAGTKTSAWAADRALVPSGAAFSTRPDPTSLRGRIWAVADELRAACLPVSAISLELHRSLAGVRYDTIRKEFHQWNSFVKTRQRPASSERSAAGTKAAEPSREKPRSEIDPSGSGAAAQKRGRPGEAGEEPDPSTLWGRIWKAADGLFQSDSRVTLASLSSHPAMRWVDVEVIKSEFARWRSFNQTALDALEASLWHSADQATATALAAIDTGVGIPSGYTATAYASSVHNVLPETQEIEKWAVAASGLATAAGVQFKDMRPAKGAFWILATSVSTPSGRKLSERLLQLGFEHVPGIGFRRN